MRVFSLLLCEWKGLQLNKPLQLLETAANFNILWLESFLVWYFVFSELQLELYTVVLLSSLPYIFWRAATASQTFQVVICTQGVKCLSLEYVSPNPPIQDDIYSKTSSFTSTVGYSMSLHHRTTVYQTCMYQDVCYRFFEVRFEFLSQLTFYHIALYSTVVKRVFTYYKFIIERQCTNQFNIEPYCIVL